MTTFPFGKYSFLFIHIPGRSQKKCQASFLCLIFVLTSILACNIAKYCFLNYNSNYDVLFDIIKDKKQFFLMLNFYGIFLIFRFYAHFDFLYNFCHIYCIFLVRWACRIKSRGMSRLLVRVWLSTRTRNCAIKTWSVIGISPNQ